MLDRPEAVAVEGVYDPGGVGALRRTGGYNQRLLRGDRLHDLVQEQIADPRGTHPYPAE